MEWGWYSCHALFTYISECLPSHYIHKHNTNTKNTHTISSIRDVLGCDQISIHIHILSIDLKFYTICQEVNVAYLFSFQF